MATLLLIYMHAFCYLLILIFFIRILNCLEPDEDGYFVWPELGPKCLHMFSSDDKISE